MRVEEIMRSEVRTVTPATDLATAGRLMGDVGCGILPVVDRSGGLSGIVTDRDLCLALARADRRPSELTVDGAMTRQVHSCALGDDVHRALATMGRFRVRRLPVLAPDGRLRGLLSLDDIAIEAHARVADELGDLLYADIARTLAAICEHPTPALAS